MQQFYSAREAKEFLVSKIIEEAQRESVVLSEPESKMLFFSESGWTLPDMAAVLDEFDRLFDQNEYEEKITRLIKTAAKRCRKESPEEYDRWWAAIRVLRKEDHYLLVMIRRAGIRPRGDLLRLWATGAAIVSALSVGIVVSARMSDKHNVDFGKYVPDSGAFGFYVWLTMLGALVAYGLFRLVLGGRTVDRWMLGVLERVFPRLK